MIIAILVIIAILGTGLIGLFIHKQYYWDGGMNDSTPFGLWISCIIFSSIITIVSVILLIFKLIQLM